MILINPPENVKLHTDNNPTFGFQRTWISTGWDHKNITETTIQYKPKPQSHRNQIWQKPTPDWSRHGAKITNTTSETSRQQSRETKAQGLTLKHEEGAITKRTAHTGGPSCSHTPPSTSKKMVTSSQEMSYKSKPLLRLNTSLCKPITEKKQVDGSTAVYHPKVKPQPQDLD